MASDPRQGKTVTRRRDKVAVPVSPFGLDSAFDLFYSAKRTEGLRTRTLNDYVSYWKYFREWLAEFHPDISDVKQLIPEVLRAYVDYMSFDHTKYANDAHKRQEGRKLSPITVASRLRALQTMGKFWEAEALISADPTAKLKAPRKDSEDKTVFTDEQIRALLDAPNTDTFAGFRDRTLMSLLADSGLRINEALRLEDAHIDLSARCIRLPGAMTKNRKPRIIPLSTSVLRDLIKLMEENRSYFDTTFIFVANYGDPLKADHFRKRLTQHAKAAGITGTPVTPHRFRAYFCTTYLVNGGDLATLQRIVAHADMKTTQGYVAVRDEVMRDSHALYSPLSRLSTKRAPRKR